MARDTGWQWDDVKQAIRDSDGKFPVFLGKMPRSEIERLICISGHQQNVYGNFEGTNGERATQIYDEIMLRGANGLQR